jgi:hypothetical protein
MSTSVFRRTYWSDKEVTALYQEIDAIRSQLEIPKEEPYVSRAYISNQWVLLQSFLYGGNQQQVQIKRDAEQIKDKWRNEVEGMEKQRLFKERMAKDPAKEKLFKYDIIRHTLPK